MDNIVKNKSFLFAARIVKLCRHLREAFHEYDMSRQLLRSGTSIGANVAEAEHAQSRADFISKMNIGLKEAAETDYWLRLFAETGYLQKNEYLSIIADCKELESLLAAIVKTSKK